jgi:hypothetical protein
VVTAILSKLKLWKIYYTVTILFFFGIIGTQNTNTNWEGLKRWDSPIGTTDFSNYYLKDLDNDFGDPIRGEYLYTLMELQV